DPPAIRQALAAYQAPALPKPVEYWLVQGDPADVILWAARVAACDLIALGGHASAERGDLATKVTNAAPCPVLIMERPSQFTLHSASEAAVMRALAQPLAACSA